MNFKLRKYMGPNFNEEKFLNAPNVLYEEVKTEGVAPDNYHAMSIYPEYFKIDGKWILAKESRMDGVVVINDNLELEVRRSRIRRENMGYSTENSLRKKSITIPRITRNIPIFPNPC